MPIANTGTGYSTIGYVEIKDKDGKLLVAFNSNDANNKCGERYQAARINYCMKHRGDKIPDYLRTGKRPFLGRRIMALLLERKLKKEVN